MKSDNLTKLAFQIESLSYREMKAFVKCAAFAHYNSGDKAEQLAEWAEQQIETAMKSSPSVDVEEAA